jgi:hypothetical protein
MLGRHLFFGGKRERGVTTQSCVALDKNLQKFFKNSCANIIFEDLRVCQGHKIYKNMPSKEINVRFLKIFVLIFLLVVSMTE